MILGGMKPPEAQSRLINPGTISRLLKNNGRKVILITRNPKSQSRGVSVLWLSSIDHPKAIDPRKLHVIEQKVWEELRRGNADVVVDGLEYLILENGQEPVLRFIGKLRDMAVLTNSNFYIVVSDALEDRLRKLLKKIIE